MANELRFRASIKDDVSGPLDKIRDKFTVATSKGAKPFFQGIAQGIGQGVWKAGFDALGQAVSGVTDYLVGSVAAAIEEQKNIAKLDTALKANIPAWDGNRDAIEKVIAAREKLAFSDDEQRASLAELVTRTHDVSKALDLEREAMDLARLKGIDLATASLIIGKVYGGNVGILQRYGIAVKAGATATEALTQIQKAAAGQAEAYGKTTQGSLESMQIAFTDLQEQIGAKLLPVVTRLAVVIRDDIIPQFDDAVKSVDGFSASLDDLMKTASGSESATFDLGQYISFLAGELKAIPEGPRAIVDWTRGFQHAASAAQNAGDAIGTVGRQAVKLKGASSAISNVGDAAANTRKDFGGLVQKANAVRDSFKNMRDMIRDAAKALGDQKYGHQELTLKIDANKLELKDLTDKLHNLEQIRHPTRQTREDIIATKLAIIDNKKEAIELKADLAASGKVSLSITKAWVDKLTISLGESGDEAARLRNLLLQIGGLSVNPNASGGNSGSSGYNGHGHADGGPEYAGVPRLVGERGSEVYVPSRNGYTLSHSDAMRALGRGGASLTINVSTPVLTPGGAQALADAIAPAITRWQQARGV